MFDSDAANESTEAVHSITIHEITPQNLLLKSQINCLPHKNGLAADKTKQRSDNI
jgi:hypothetical protein